MSNQHRVALSLGGILCACLGVWAGSEFHFWMLSLGIDLGDPHPALALLEVGFIGVIANEVRLAYFEHSPYDHLVRARRAAVFMTDTFFIACIFGAIVGPIGNQAHKDAWVNPLSILLIAIFIPLLLLGKDLAIDIASHFRRRR